MPAQKIPLAAALAAGLGNGGDHHSDRDGENLQIRIGLDLTTGKVGLEFSHPVQDLRIPRNRARELALGILRLLGE